MILIVRTTGWPIEFPLTAEIAARCYQLEMARIARGSAMECAAIIHAARVLGVVDQVKADRARDLLIRIVQMLTKLCR